MELAPQAMMSSKEVAVLTKKELGNIHRDIWDMLSQLYGVEKDASEMNHHKNQSIKVVSGISIQLDNRGYVSFFSMDRRHTEILITGYDVKRRAAVIDRWFELEKKVRLPEYDSSESFISLEQAKIGIELLEASGRLLTLSKSETVDWLSGLHKAAGLPDFPSQLERNEPDSIQEAVPPAPTQQLALLVKPETSSLAALLREYNIDSPSASVFTMLYKHGFVERRFKTSQLKNRGVKTKEGYWYLTDKGLYYGENANKSRERGETHPRFYDNRFGELLFQLGYIC